MDDATLDTRIETMARDLYHRSGLALETFSWHDINDEQREHFRQRVLVESSEAAVLVELRVERAASRTLRDALKDFDYVDLGMLLDLIEDLACRVPAYSMHAGEGDNEACDRAREVVERFKAAVVLAASVVSQSPQPEAALMATLKRRLLTIYPPMLVDTFCGLQRVVEAEFPGAVLEYGESGGPFHVVVTEQLEDDDPRLITPARASGLPEGTQP